MAHTIDKSADTKQALERALRLSLTEIGLRAESHRKENETARDTGRLRNSITYRVFLNEETVIVGTNVEYGVYHELGTGKFASLGTGRRTPWAFKDRKGKWHMTHGVQALHYLTRAFTEHIDEYKSVINHYFRNA